MCRCSHKTLVMHKFVAVLAATATCLLVQHSARAEIDLIAEATAGYTNNLLRVPNGDSDVPVTIGVTGTWVETTRHLTADVRGTVEGTKYLDDNFDEEVLGQLAGTAMWWPVPEQLGLEVTNVYGQISTDPFSPIGPANRQNTNYLSAGPDWFIPIGGRTRAYLGGRYGSTRYEETTDSNSERMTGIVGIDRAVTSSSRLGVQASAETLDYDSDLLDVDRNEAYLRYEFTRGTEPELVVNAGYTWLSTDTADQSAPLLELQLLRPLTASLKFQLEIVSRFSDAGRGFAAGESSGLSGGTEPIVFPEYGVFEERGGSAGLVFERARTSLNLGVGVFDELYEMVALNRRRYDAELQVERRMSERMTGLLGVVWSRNNFESDGAEREDTDTSYRLEVQREIGRRTSLALVGSFASRSSDDPTIEYDETRCYVVFGYSLR